MKVTAIAGILISVLMCSPTLAQTDWVSRFLARYSPPKTTQAAQTDALSLTTADIIRLLLQNNRDVNVSRAAPVSSLYSIASAFRPFEPNFHVIGNLDHSTTPSSNVLAGAVSLVQLKHDYRVGIDQSLQTGTAYTVDFEFIRSSSNSVFNVYNPGYNGVIKYGLTQHVLRDFGYDANSREIRIARNNLKISELDFELQVIELITEALNSYWDLVFAGEDVKVKQRSLELASKTMRDNEIQVEVGTLAAIDLIQAESEVATRNDDLVTAQYTVAQQQDEMKKRITSQTDPGLAAAHLNLVERVRRPDTETLLPLSQAIQFALENRREMKQAGYDLDNTEVDVRYFKNQMRPVLDLSAGYAHSGLGGTKTIRSGIAQGNEVLQVIPGGVGDMFSQLFSYNFPDYSAGFALQIPLRDRARRADYDRAVNERAISEKRKAATAQLIALEVRNAFTQVDMNRERVTTARKARDLAERRLDAEQKKFELGASTVRFVLEEQRNVAQAETNEIQALVNFTKALVMYDHAIGNTLARNNVAIEKQLPAQLTSKGTEGN